jgi:ATP-dependent Zn protease
MNTPYRTPLSGLRMLAGLARPATPLAPVLTVGTTTDSAQLDPALLRPGAFDRQLTLPLPDAAGRADICAYYLIRITPETFDYDALAAHMEGFTPALIKQAIYEALLYAHQDERDTPSVEDIVRACGVYRAALAPAAATTAADEPDEEQPALSAEAQRRMACYDAGQLYVQARVAPPGMRVPLFTSPPDELEQYPYSRDELLAAMQVALAGRAAEEELLGMHTSLAAEDMQHAATLADLIVGRFGMAMQRADATAPAESQELMQEQYQQVRRLIGQNHAAVRLLSDALLMQDDLAQLSIRDMLAHIETRHPFVALNNTAAARHAAPSYLVARRAAEQTGAPDVLPPPLPDTAAITADDDALPLPDDADDRHSDANDTPPLPDEDAV